MIDTKAFFDPATNTVTYLVWDSESRAAVIIDPVLDYEPQAAALSTDSADIVLDYINEAGLNLTWVLETHAHADHLSAAHYIKSETQASIGIGARITEVQTQFQPLFMANDMTPDGGQFDQLFDDGDQISLGNETVTVMHTPGHTPACVTYVINDMAFVGDTLFMPDYGTARADFPGGDAATLYRSIRRILSLPDDTRIMVGHDYLPKGRKTHAWETTVARHKSENIHISNHVSEADYVTMRNARDKTLKAPRLILPSLQVNIRAEDGFHYLTIPINRI